MVVGERNRSIDMNVNIVKEKKLTNMRSSTSDQTVILRPARPMSLDQCIEFIAEDELVEAARDPAVGHREVERGFRQEDLAVDLQIAGPRAAVGMIGWLVYLQANSAAVRTKVIEQIQLDFPGVDVQVGSAWVRPPASRDGCTPRGA